VDGLRPGHEYQYGQEPVSGAHPKLRRGLRYLPPAYFDDLGPVSRDPLNRNVIRGLRATQWLGSTVFNQRLCDELSWADVLGSTAVHEAMHRCNNGFGISDARSDQSGCSANSLERFCTGISSPGGT
jgi:hypothetical protein